MSNAYRCPYCSSPTTPFAAGCAYCGADLRKRPSRPAAAMHRLRDRLRTPRRPVAPVRHSGGKP